MGLQSGGDSVAAAGSCSGGAVLEAPLDGGGLSVVMVPLVGSGGGGHTSDLVSGETRLTSLAPVHGARVPVGRPLRPIWIHAICLYADLGGNSDADMASTGSSSSPSSATATSTTHSASMTPSFPSSSPSLGLGDNNTELLSATG
jgi:hypothetical protein